MKKNLKIILLSLLFVVFVVLVFVLLINNILLGTVFGLVGLIIIGILSYLTYTTHSVKYLYKKELARILDKNKSLLVKSSTLPRLDKKNIVILDSIFDLIEKQNILRKTIYYKVESNCCVFSLSDSLEINIYILKVNDTVVSEIEKLIQEKEERRNNKNSDFSILEDVEKKKVTLEDAKEFKVSPANMMHVTDEMKDDLEENRDETIIDNNINIVDVINDENDVEDEEII